MSLKIPFFVTGLILVGVFFINYRNFIITNNIQWTYMMVLTAVTSLVFIVVSQFIDKPYGNTVEPFRHGVEHE